MAREPCEMCDDTTDTYVGSPSLGLDGYYCRGCLTGRLGASADVGFVLVLPEDARRALLAFPSLQAAATRWLRTARRDAIRRRVSAGATWTDLAREMGITRSAVRKAAEADAWIPPKVGVPVGVGATRRTA
ncbi:MAG: hypothetical protein ACYCST_11380 [Acidimicrobiales bacterium]